MNILSLSKLFSSIIGHQIYVINFPEFTQGLFIKMEITSGIYEAGGVQDFNVQLMVKANHPAEAEEVAIEILNKLDMTTDKEFNEGSYQLILCKASSPQPFYVGEAEGEYIFSVDFRILACKI